MGEIKTFRELQKELNKLYAKLRPICPELKWTEKPEIRKQLDEFMDKKYMVVENSQSFEENNGGENGNSK